MVMVKLYCFNEMGKLRQLDAPVAKKKVGRESTNWMKLKFCQCQLKIEVGRRKFISVKRAESVFRSSVL